MEEVTKGRGGEAEGSYNEGSTDLIYTVWYVLHTEVMASASTESPKSLHCLTPQWAILKPPTFTIDLTLHYTHYWGSTQYIAIAPTHMIGVLSPSSPLSVLCLPHLHQP